MVKIMLDKERVLKYTFADILEIRQKYAEKDLTLEQLAEVILRGLKRDDPKLTLEKLYGIIDMERFPELMLAMRKASGLASPAEPGSPAEIEDRPTPAS